MFTCWRNWTLFDIIKNTCREMSIPEREQDSLNFASVKLSLLSDGGGKSIDDFQDLEDGSKVLVEVSSIGTCGK